MYVWDKYVLEYIKLSARRTLEESYRMTSKIAHLYHILTPVLQHIEGVA